VLSKVGLALRVTFLLEDAGQATKRLRAITVGVLVALVFLLMGTVRAAATIAEHFGHSPFNFDTALRTLSAGWFDTTRTIPIAIVDIDEATHEAWGSPVITPRGDLERILEVVTAAAPSAVVVDVDLSWGDSSTPAMANDEGNRRLREFLEHYAGPAPILFPKRIDPAGDGLPHAAPSPLDPIFLHNSHLVWTHAAFQTDANGKVRQWQEWLAVCTATGTDWLPAVPVAIAANVATVPVGLERPSPPTSAATDCAAAAREPAGLSRRLLVGPRLTGPGRHRLMRDATVVSASLLLDPDMARDDRRLFTGRVVFVGASHVSSGDFWLTPSGVLPGVELLASMTRFAPLQFESTSRASRILHRGSSVVLFAFFAWLAWKFRALVALALGLVAALVFLAIAVGVLDDFVAYDVLEAAVLMMIVYTAIDSVLEFVADVKAGQRRAAAGGHAWRDTLAAVCLKRHDAAMGDEHEHKTS
jgi:CHASE2 domain-containing sensor protein